MRHAQHTGLLLGLLHAVGATQTGTWHWVDIAAVICEKNASAPPSPPYSVGIEYTSGMDLDAPHILGFMRTSNNAMKVTFRVEDNLGKQVFAEQSFTLAKLGQAAPSTCQCNRTLQLPKAISALAPPAGYGANYGIMCRDHDNDYCDKWWGNSTVGRWCCREWCYVTSKKDCPDAYESQLVDGLYWSDIPCYIGNPRTEVKYSDTCKWTELAKKNDPCACRYSYSLFSADMKDKFFKNYGEYCWAWDTQSCRLNYDPSQIDTWCCSNWCYVDRTCPSAIPSMNKGLEETLFWSGNVCPDDPKKMSQCEFKPVINKSSAGASNCTCLNEQMPSNLLPSNVEADYGQKCMPHDIDHCKTTYPGAEHDMWCCESWCWVDESCPGSMEHPSWPGHYRSKVSCELDADAISSCPYSRACECAASPSTDLLNKNTNGNNPFPVGYGGSCKAWDSTGCKDVWGPGGSANYAAWDSNAENGWCCASWCYVSESCPIAKQSWLGIGYYFSYETCDDGSETYLELEDTCDNRTRLRRLSGRRRFSSSSSRSRSSWSSPRRRAPYAPSTPRRRRSSYSAPGTPRRRRVVPPPRRRIRRRRSPAQVTSATQIRRRTTSLNGQTYQTSSGTSYGYTSQPQMMNGYGGGAPHQTSYGYAGYNAYPSKSNSNIAMYAGGGFVAGAATMYMLTPSHGYGYGYNHYDYGGGYGYHRHDAHRRRMHRGRYCIVPEGRCATCYHQPWIGERDRPGDLIECGDCYQRYSYCLDTSSCYTTTGCGYQTEKDYNRDDLAATGFAPKDFQSPLKVIITSIESPDFISDPSKSNICPPVTQAQRDSWEEGGVSQSLKMDLFLIMTKQDKLDTPPACDRDTRKGCGWDDQCTVDGSFCEADRMCRCPQGACYSRNRGRCSADQNVDGAARGELAWLVLMIVTALVCQTRFGCE